jgi:putative membrane protein
VRRRPRWVYDVGSEPDPRFTLANERTLLAWLRTSLAMQAAGIAAEAFAVPQDPVLRRALVVAVVAVGALICINAFLRWARAERALRQAKALPGHLFAPLLCAALGGGGFVLLVGLF